MFMSQKKVVFESPSAIVTPRKFDTALRDSFMDSMNIRHQNNSPNVDDLVLIKHPRLKDMDVLSFSRSTTHYSRFLKNLIYMQDSAMLTSRAEREQMNMIYKMAARNAHIQIRYLLSTRQLPDTRDISALSRKKLENISVDPFVRILFHAATWFSNVISKMTKLELVHKKYRNISDKAQYISELCKVNYEIHDRMKLELIWSWTKVVIRVNNQYYIMPRPTILMYHNKICDLISVYVFCSLEATVSLPSDSTSILMHFIICLINLHIEYDGKFFDIARVLEGLVIAETLIQVEEWTNVEFLRCIDRDLETNTGFVYQGSELQSILKSCNIPLRHELGCLSKLLGHPLVDMKGGSKTLFDKTTAVVDISYKCVHSCINYIKQNYIQNHIIKYGKWPPCHLTTHAIPKALEMAYLLGKDPHCLFIKQKWGDVSINDYAFIELEKNMKFTKLENILPHLKDKTISILRSKVISKYIECQEDTKVTWRDTRLLLAFLINPSMVYNINKYMEDYTESDDLEELLDYLVIRIVPKEKELKTKFRGFGCKTAEDRHRSLAQEKNVMRFLNEFSDEEAMTLSELQLIRKLDSFRKLHKAYKGCRLINIVIDASSWNNRFRHETVGPVLDHTLDKIFGTTIFRKTHIAYQKSLIYVPDLTKTYLWYGQAGGIEGLNQDTWVVVYLAQIKVAMESVDFQYHVLCKGDDLRITVLIPPEQQGNIEVAEFKNRIVRNISRVAQQLGHTINIEESYGSSRYLAFSKTASIDNIELPQVFRKIQKCYGANNAFLETLDDYIASTFSNAHSAARVSVTSLSCYIVGLVWMFYYITSHEAYKHFTESQLVGLSLVPSICGGFPIIYLHNMPIRAESDLLSPFLGLIQFMTRYRYAEVDTMRRFCITKQHAREHREILLYDPYAIPTPRPTLPETMLRGMILPALKGLSQNRDVQELISCVQSDIMADIKEVLLSCNILNAKTLSALHSCTPAGATQELLSKFENSRSVLELLILRYGKKRGENMLRRVIKCENILQNWRARVINDNHEMTDVLPFTHLIRPCPAESAFLVRKFCYQKEVYEVTMPPMQHQIILVSPISPDLTPWDGQNHFTYRLHDADFSLQPHISDHYKTGDKVRPFLGYITRTGMIEPNVHFVEKDALLSKLKNLLNIITWTDKEGEDPQGNIIISNSHRLIAKLINCYTDIPLRTLAPFAGTRRSGTIQHHLRSPAYKASIIPNSLNNLYSLWSGESNTHLRFHRSTQHYAMNFLHCYCYVLFSLMFDIQLTSVSHCPRRIWAVTVNCDFCNIPIQEYPITFSEPLIRNLHVPLMSLLSMGEVSTNILRESVQEFIRKPIHVPPMDEETTLLVASQGVLQEMMDNTYFNRKAIQDRYHNRDLTDEGLDILTNISLRNATRDIGLTELKCIRVNDIIDYIACILFYVIPSFSTSSSATSGAYWINSLPLRELPWYGLVVQLHKLNILPIIVREISHRTRLPLTPVMYNVEGATRYIGIGCLVLLETIHRTPPIVILSYYTINQCVQHLSYKIKYTIKNSIVSDVVKEIPRRYTKDAQTEIDINILHLLMRGLGMVVTARILEEDLIMISNQISDDGRRVFPLYELDRANTDALYTILEEINEVDNIPEEILTNQQAHVCRPLLRLIILYKEFLIDQWDEIEVYFNTYTNGFLARQTFEVEYTTLSNCISVVRANRMQTIEDTGALVEEHLEDQVPVKNMNIQIKWNEALIHRVISTKPIPHDIISIDLQPYRGEDEREGVQSEYFHRPIGLGNSSQSLFYWLLLSLGIEELPAHTCYACFHDGIGGFTAAINSMTNHSVILYHTRVFDDNYDRYPDSALHHNNDNQIIYDYLHEGYDDITHPSVIEKIMAYNLLYNIVTCDIQLPITETDEYYLENLWALCVFYLRCRTIDGMLILPFDMRRNYINSLIITELCPYIRYHVLIMPKGQVNRNRIYYVVQGTRIPVYTSLDLPSQSSNRAISALNRVVALLRRPVREVEFYDSVVYNFSALTNRALAKYIIHGEVYPITVLAHRLSIQVNLEAVEGEAGHDLCRAETFKNAFLIARLNLSDMIYMTWKELSTPDFTSIKSLSWDSNTQAHRLNLLHKYFFMKGYEYAYLQYNGVTEPYVLFLKYIDENYISIFGRLHPRDIPEELTENPRLKFTNVNGVRFHYYSAYFDGINIFISLYGYLSMIGGIKDAVLDE